MREGAEREPYLWATVPSGNVGVSVDGLRLGVVGVAKKCLVARVEILMGAEPKMTSFLVEDLDEVLELSD